MDKCFIRVSGQDSEYVKKIAGALTGYYNTRAGEETEPHPHILQDVTDQDPKRRLLIGGYRLDVPFDPTQYNRALENISALYPSRLAHAYAAETLSTKGGRTLSAFEQGLQGAVSIELRQELPICIS